MLFGRVSHFLGGELLQSADYAEAGVAGLDDVVDIAVLGRVVRIAEKLVVFSLSFGEHLCGVVRFLCFLGVEHFYGACASHNCDFCSRPCVVHVAAELLAAHHDVAAAIALAERNGDFGHSSFAVSVKELGSMENHAVVFLTCSGEESGHVNQSDQRNIESVAEAYKAGAFARSVAVEHAGKEFGLVSHDAHGLTVEAGALPGIRRCPRWRR